MRWQSVKGSPLPLDTELFKTVPTKEGDRELEETRVVGAKKYQVYEKQVEHRALSRSEPPVRAQSTTRVGGRLRTVTTHTLVVDAASSTDKDDFSLQKETAASRVRWRFTVCSFTTLSGWYCRSPPSRRPFRPSRACRMIRAS